MKYRSAAYRCTAAALASGLLACAVVAGAQNAAPAAPAAPSGKLSWYGDPKAPDISGVWVRVPEAAGSKSPEGWTPFPPPLKGEYAAAWKKAVADTAAGTRTDDPVQACLPPGMPRYMTGLNTPMIILQTPGRVMMYRDGIPVRRIWLDGRPFPAAKDIESFSNGNAFGHYEGQALVTEIRGVKTQPIDSSGIPHSDDLVIKERIQRIDATTLRVEVTLTDKTAYTKPMKSVVTYKSGDPMWEPREFLCQPQKNYHPEIYVK